jgi:arylsulfatase A-like enzyme
LTVTLAALVLTGGVSTAAAPPERPNIIFVFVDNLGYGDIGCFGSTKHRTPHIDRLAEQGVRFTHFYSSSGVCTPSRASLMTGCYPRRINMHQDPRGGAVLRPRDNKGLHPDETTIAEVLKRAGYATTIIGKWHLGDQPEFLPTRQGFDSYLGIPYSDDMTADKKSDVSWPPLPLVENEAVIEAPVDRNGLTKRYTERAIEWIERHKDGPFFLYLPHAMPGSTRAPYASDAFRGKSANGPWGDSVEELDWSMGQIMDALDRLKLNEKTLVIWTSDNGAPRRNPPQGLNLPLGGWGYSTSEGGQRIPCVMRWTGQIPAGTECAELATTMDMLPTFACLAGIENPVERKIDGKDVTDLILAKPGAKTPHEAFYYYHVRQLQAVRSGQWKLFLPLTKRQRNLRGDGTASRVELYDVVADPGETTNRAADHPDVVGRLTALAEIAREELGDEGRLGSGQRDAGWSQTRRPMALPAR